MQRIPTRSLALAALLWLTPLQSHAEDYTYITNNGTITITSYLGPGGAVAVPNAINGLPVTTIGDWAFLSSTNLTSLDVPDTVTDIANYAFYSCTNLASVTLPSSLTNIGIAAFMFCSGLNDVLLPTNINSVGPAAFAQCTALTKVAIPASVNLLGPALFYGSTSLTAITVDSNNPFYTSVDGVLFNKDLTTFLEWPAGKAQSCTIPYGV